MTKEERLKFISMIGALAVQAAKAHDNKIFPSVCIAQACKETGYGGGSPLMMKYNAPFGIKVGKSKYHFGTAWRDKSYNTRTKEVHNGEYQIQQDDFRAYDSLMDAVTDYYDLLTVASRYRAAVNAKTPADCIRAIAPSYATAEQLNHAYSNSIIQIIADYNLTRYDTDGIAATETGAGLFTTSDLNLRKGDGVQYDKILVIPKGARVSLRGFVPVSYNGIEGFVSSKYLEVKGG